MATRLIKTRSVTEFGDFQTPPALARATTKLLYRLGIRPSSILEPTCGKGAFLDAAATTFPEARRIIGVDINQGHLREAAALTSPHTDRIELQHGDFFRLAWNDVVSSTAGPWLILGNPPWVTSAGLGAIESNNLPEKSNFHGRMGIEAITGKSNFDISEWMILRYLDWLSGQAGTVAVLCKTAVARKILLHVWKKNISLQRACIFRIDAFAHFGAAVDACLFVLQVCPFGTATQCDIYDSLDAAEPKCTIGFLDGHLISDVHAFQRHRTFLGSDHHYVWRSGIKHDCSKVMELAVTPSGYKNGFGEDVVVEDLFLYPLLKSSDVGNERLNYRNYMIVTQTAVGENTATIRDKAPLTWRYLTKHATLLDGRGSVIYRNKPPFSIFGVGPYSFTPWKVAISGFYKRLNFLIVGPADGRPVVFDDTVNFLPCRSSDEAHFIAELLQSGEAQSFYHSMIHWDDKRPITIDLLKRLNIYRLAVALGREVDYSRFSTDKHLLLV